jgi:DNA polymerase-3 subunit gamma/tau
MSYIALYREWRPTRFRDVVEQEHVVKTLLYSVKTGRIAHAYLFCGTRGTGKTTMAHILSRAVNCLDPQDGEPCNQCEVCREILSGSCVDVLEIDAASNNSVDNVRSIRDEVIYAPTRAKRKVYIIDEVHMLSTGAFNALLKTLEEPPEHVIFILATTEPHKLPATILSRCQRFDFRRISRDSIARHIDMIASSDNVKLAPAAAKLIARMSDGAMRDAISILDQCISLGKESISYDDVLTVAGIVNDEFMTGFVESMLDRNAETILHNVSRLVDDGRDTAHFVSDLVVYFRNMLICKSTNGSCDDLIEVPTEVLQIMKQQTARLTLDEIIHRIRELSALEYNMKYAANPKVLLEVTLIKLCGNSGHTGSDIEERLAAIERRLESGDFRAFPASAGPAASASSGSSTSVRPDASDSDSPIYTNTSAGTLFADPFADSMPADTDSKANENLSETTKTADSSGTTKLDRQGSGYPEYDQWPNIMNHLKSVGRMAIYSFLLNVKAVLLNDQTIGLIPKDSNIKSLVSKPEHMKVIEDAVLKVTKREMKIMCIEETTRIKLNTDDKPESSDLLRRARKIADKAGLPLEIIDE